MSYTLTVKITRHEVTEGDGQKMVTAAEVEVVSFQNKRRIARTTGSDMESAFRKQPESIRQLFQDTF